MGKRRKNKLVGRCAGGAWGFDLRVGVSEGGWSGRNKLRIDFISARILGCRAQAPVRIE